VIRAALLVLAALCARPLWAETSVVLVQSTTSTQNSGLYDAILPVAEAALGLDIRVVAVGTGQAIQNASRCDGDLLVTHARTAEVAFVAQGFGTVRHDLMYNDFVLVGPIEDRAEVGEALDAEDAFARIAAAGALFASRGDDSGTHQAERALWPDGIDLDAASGRWYRETGSGMGATLNIAAGMGAYTMTDRATWLAFENRATLRIVFENDPAFFNQYGLVPVSPSHCPSVNAQGTTALVDWLLSVEGQAAIAAFRVQGEQVFFPNAAP